MSASHVLKTATAAAHDAIANTSGGAFLGRVRVFVDALARVPDHPATEFSPLEIEQLSSKAEHVIAAIERHIEDEPEPGGKQALTDAVDEMKRQIEEINRWRRHYLQSPG